MDKKELLFYDEYEEFYAMAKTSDAFSRFCKDAFGEDFSQDGFSDIKQIDELLEHIPHRDNMHILDIGCGNGKMLGYMQKKTNAYIYGFDYSGKAIETARNLFNSKAEFRQGIIGEIEYSKEQFDVIVSMDTMYFAKDMSSFVSQIKTWLKEEGVFLIGYQEGEVMEKTKNASSTVLAKALQKNGMHYTVKDITRETYDLLKKKRQCAMKYQAEFKNEGNDIWYNMLLGQTECVLESYEKFRTKMARYIYVVRKS